jgi:hypothetical protein
LNDSGASSLCWNALSVAALTGILIFGSDGFLPAAPQKPQETAAAVSGQSTIDEIANIDIRTDLRIFTVMAAVTAAGFDENSGRQGKLAGLLRQDLADLDPGLRERLRAAFNERPFLTEQDQHTAYTSLALLLTGPPDFQLQTDAPEIPLDVQKILGFEELLPEFYEKAHIAVLWERYRTEYETELEAYRPVILDVIHKTIEYFHIPPRIALDRSIVVMSDLLGLQNVVHARNLERTYYIVLGPADQPQNNFDQIQHEYLHFLIDPLIEKSGGQLLKERSLMQLAEQQPNLRRDFRGRFLLTVDESLIEAVMHRLHPVPAGDEQAETVKQFRRGLIFFPFFMRELVKFEAAGREPFPAYLAGTLVSIPEDQIEEDATHVLEWELQFAARKKAEQAAAEETENQERQRQEVQRLLAEAGQLIADKSWPEATNRLERLLQIQPENGSALFYLGQIAAQQQKPDLAASYYSRAEASDTAEPWVKAWCAVRLGRFLAYQRKFDEARRKFEGVLALGDDFKGARRAAQESLTHLPPAEQHQ